MPLKAYTKGQPRISRHFCGDMHPDDATGSVYHGSVAHISRPPLCLGLCQGGCFLLRHWQMEKVEEQIPSWGIAVLCAETRFCRRLCARTLYALYGIICAQRRQSGNASAHWLHTKDAVSDGLRNRFTWGRDSLPELHTIPVFPSIVFHVKLCLSLISHTGFCR